MKREEVIKVKVSMLNAKKRQERGGLPVTLIKKCEENALKYTRRGGYVMASFHVPALFMAGTVMVPTSYSVGSFLPSNFDLGTVTTRFFLRVVILLLSFKRKRRLGLLLR